MEPSREDVATAESAVKSEGSDDETKLASTEQKVASKQGDSLRTLLNLSSQQLYGRNEEEAQLVQAYQRAMNSSNCELVLISGQSGTGKTTLARNTLRKQHAQVIAGKFCPTKQPPFAVFVQALTEYVERMVDTYHHRIPVLKSKIDEMADISLLTDLIPALNKIVGQQPPTASKGVASQAARFKYVFSRLIQAIATVHPLVILLDDVTWADDASLEIVESLLMLKEKDAPLALMVVGTHRPLDESSNLFKLLKHVDSSILTEIALTDWSVTLVNEFVSDLLDQELSDTLSLSKQIHSQTQGNIFYVLQYLRLLEEQGLLRFDASRETWRWDLTKLELTSASELLSNKLEQLPTEVRETLQVAACMGDEVDDSALLIIFNDRDRVALSLEQAANAGLLVLSQGIGYKFAHDRIRQVVSSLLEEPDQFKLNLGRKLWDHANDDNIFVVVTLLNRGRRLIHYKHERYRLAELNLKAGLIAITLSAFPDAAFYLNSGIDLLGRAHWEEDYRLSLELYDNAAEVEMVNANFERVRELITEVLAHATTLQDKMRSYATLMSSMGQQGDLEEALTTGFKVLRALGHPIPRKASKFNVAKDFMRTKWMMRNMTIDDFCSMPLMTNGNKIWCSEILNLMSIYAVLSRSPFVPIIALRTIQLCIRHGLSRGSSWGFAFYGIAFVARGDLVEAERQSHVALAVLEASQAHEMLPRVYVIVYSGVYHWTRPLRETLEPLKFASRVGMEVGDVEHAMLCINRWLVHCYYCGVDLTTLEEDFVEYAHQMKAYKQENCLISFNLIGQLIHNLTGRSEDPSILRGHILDIDVALQETKETHSKAFEASCVQYSAYVAYLFGDYERAHELEESLARIHGFVNCFWGKVAACFVQGLAAIALARKGSTSRKEFVRTGKKCCVQMSAWAEHCPSNFRHKQKLLEAELMGIDQDGDSVAVVALYDEAIECAKNEGIIHEEALGYELASVYMARIGDETTASEYRARARSLYQIWGATAKASALLTDEVVAN